MQTEIVLKNKKIKHTNVVRFLNAMLGSNEASLGESGLNTNTPDKLELLVVVVT